MTSSASRSPSCSSVGSPSVTRIVTSFRWSIASSHARRSPSAVIGFVSVRATPSATKRAAVPGSRNAPTTTIGTGSVKRIVEQRLDELRGVGHVGVDDHNLGGHLPREPDRRLRVVGPLALVRERAGDKVFVGQRLGEHFAPDEERRAKQWSLFRGIARLLRQLARPVSPREGGEVVEDMGDRRQVVFRRAPGLRGAIEDGLGFGQRLRHHVEMEHSRAHVERVELSPELLARRPLVRGAALGEDDAEHVARVVRLSPQRRDEVGAGTSERRGSRDGVGVVGGLLLVSGLFAHGSPTARPRPARRGPRLTPPASTRLTRAASLRQPPSRPAVIPSRASGPTSIFNVATWSTNVRTWSKW